MLDDYKHMVGTSKSWKYFQGARESSVIFGTSPEKQPAGSGPYANAGGIRSFRFPPV